MDELFNNLTRIIAHPHTAITDHDRIRAARVLLAIGDIPAGNGIPDFGAYASQVIDELEGRGRINKTPS